MSDDKGVLAELQQWYEAQCDEDWEHAFGISISTIDNPGWRVSVDLAETILELKLFTRIEIENSETDWMHCWVEEGKYQAAGGPTNLKAMVQTFLDWAKTERDWLQRPECSAEEQEAIKDLAFWESLGPEIEAEECRSEGCSDSRVKFSVFCRAHHFHQLTGKHPNFV